MVNIVCWNIRGLNAPSKQAAIKVLISSQRLACFALVETKIKEHNIEAVHKALCPTWELQSCLCQGVARILLFWNPKFLKFDLISSTHQALHGFIHLSQGAHSFSLSIVYGFNSHMGRESLWRDLIQAGSSHSFTPWLVMGDFNAIRFPHEKQGGRISWTPQDAHCNLMLNEAGLIDHAASGPLFTWNNGHEDSFKQRKLDRILANSTWLSTYPNATAHFGSPLVSDHSYMLVQLPTRGQGIKSPFKFFNFWATHKDFLPLIEDAWRSQVRGKPLFQIYSKLGIVKAELKKLNSDFYSNLPDALQLTTLKLQDCQLKLQTNPHDRLLIRDEKQLSSDLLNLYRDLESFWKQKSRIQWLHEGDRNSAFFFRSVQALHNRTRITAIKTDEGSWLHSKDEICNAFISYYKNLLGSTTGLPPLNGNLLSTTLQPSITAHQVETLASHVSIEEIKGAFFSLHQNKAPGPDGFNGFFFHKVWHIIGPDLLQAIHSCFTDCSLLKQANSTIIALVPKIPQPEYIKDFRPISCCNTIYKTISKLLANRLKAVLPSLIHDTQSAFVQDRSISDNILLAQELMVGYEEKKRSPCCAIKVDLSKAFDSVRWDFIWLSLSLLGFPPIFINWIKMCVQGAWYSVSINGELHGYFRGQRGLRQGCPLSPYLFTIVMHVFSMLLLQEIQSNSTFKYHWRCKKSKLSHLCFADDLFLFCHADMSSMATFKSVLDTFSMLSGLKPNYSKSEVFLTGVDDDLKAALYSLMGFSAGKLPIRYLGVPLIAGRLKASHCGPLVERITKRISSWTSTCLSYAGRLQLIKAVLFAFHTYWSRHFTLPSSIHKKIDSLLRSFLWKGKSDSTSGNKVAWKDIAQPKESGGLGIKAVKIWNYASVAKLIWILLNPRSTSIWASWIRGNYLHKDHFWNVKLPSKCSWAWKKILQMRPAIRPHFSWKIGNGALASLWYDHWLPNGCIHARYGNRIIYDSGIQRDATVSSLIRDGLWIWPTANSTCLLALKREPHPPYLPNSDAEDSLLWKPSVNGLFTISSAYTAFASHLPPRQLWRIPWIKGHIPRYSFIFWLALRQRLIMDSSLHHWGFHLASRCSLCYQAVEDFDHLFFQCTFSSSLWGSLCFRSGHHPFSTSSSQWQSALSHAIQCHSPLTTSGAIYILSLHMAVYHLWKERNKRLHGERGRPPQQLGKEISWELQDILAHSFKLPNHHWLCQPWGTDWGLGSSGH